MGSTVIRKKKVIFVGLIVAVELLVCLILADIGLGWWEGRIEESNRLDPGLIQYDRILGWALTPGWTGTHGHHDFEVTYSINEHGFRGRFPDLSQPKVRPRVGVLGDSFTFGFGVNDGETFVDLLQQGDPDRDYLNLAVPGYSTDQEYLLMRNRGRSLEIDHYLLVIYLGNDFLDNALPWPLQTQLAKPYFELTEAGDLVLRNTPVPREPKPAEYQRLSLASETFGDELAAFESRWLPVLHKSHLLSRILPDRAPADKSVTDSILDRRQAPRIRLVAALLDAIQEEAAKQGASLTVVLLPGQSLVTAPDSWSGRFQWFVGERIGEMCQIVGVEAIDITAALLSGAAERDDAKKLFHPNEGHFTVYGHRLVETILLEAIAE